MITSMEKPGTPAELVHFGVKGMKWGVRRREQAARNAAFVRKFPTARSREKEIFRARKQTKLDRRHFERAKTVVERERARKVFLNNPDRATALRMTKGEKVTHGVIAGLLGAASPFGVAIGLHAAWRVSKRHRIEREQAAGKIR